jgi:putative transposase
MWRMGWADTLATYVSSCHTIYMDYMHEQNTIHLIVYHIIWCSKRRRKVLIALVAERLAQLFHEAVDEYES